MKKITENTIEEFAIELLERLGYQYVYAPEIAPDGERPERSSYGDVLLINRLRKAVSRINPENNEFIVANQFTVIENGNNKRADVIPFANGIPLAVIELKNPADENATVRSAYRQLQTYKEIIPILFTYIWFYGYL